MPDVDQTTEQMAELQKQWLDIRNHRDKTSYERDIEAVRYKAYKEALDAYDFTAQAEAAKRKDERIAELEQDRDKWRARAMAVCFPLTTREEASAIEECQRLQSTLTAQSDELRRLREAMQGKIYDAQKGVAVPLSEAVGYMDERWLGQWGCEQTTLDLLRIAREASGEGK